MENKSQKQLNDEQLRIENQVRKIKLELEHGAKFGSFTPNHVLPPHIEKMFLDNVERIEKAFKEAKKIKIYDLIGRPEFKKTGTLNDEELAIELDKVHGKLYEHQIFCDSMYDVDNRKLYSFITEELFEELIDDVSVPGFIANFIYENYYPNYEAEIGDMSYEFILSLLKNNEKFEFEEFEDAIKNAKQLHNFRDSYRSFEITHLDLESVVINQDKAVAIFKAEFTGLVEASSIRQKFSVKITVDLSLDSKYWDIIKVSFPGLSEE